MIVKLYIPDATFSSIPTDRERTMLPPADMIDVPLTKSIEKIHDLRSIEVKLVWEPAWNKDLMSEDAKLALDIF